MSREYLLRRSHAAAGVRVRCDRSRGRGRRYDRRCGRVLLAWAASAGALGLRRLDGCRADGGAGRAGLGVLAGERLGLERVPDLRPIAAIAALDGLHVLAPEWRR